MTHKHLCYSVVSILMIFFTNVFFLLLWISLGETAQVYVNDLFGTQYTVNNLLKSDLKEPLNFLDHHSKQCFLDSPHIICPNIQLVGLQYTVSLPLLHDILSESKTLFMPIVNISVICLCLWKSSDAMSFWPNLKQDIFITYFWTHHMRKILR